MAIEKILIKRTGVAGRVPTAESLDVGELAINTADKKIYSKHGDEVIEFTETPASVKAKYESNANTNVFTDAEKTKLGGLDSNHFKGLYASLSALQTAHPTAVSGDYANVDAGAGSEVQSYIWDASDNEWVLQMGESTAETAASIKTKYESNPDTNAFTDAYKGQVDTNATNIGTLQTQMGDIATALDLINGE